MRWADEDALTLADGQWRRCVESRRAEEFLPDGTEPYSSAWRAQWDASERKRLQDDLRLAQEVGDTFASLRLRGDWVHSWTSLEARDIQMGKRKAYLRRQQANEKEEREKQRRQMREKERLLEDRRRKAEERLKLNQQDEERKKKEKEEQKRKESQEQKRQAKDQEEGCRKRKKAQNKAAADAASSADTGGRRQRAASPKDDATQRAASPKDDATQSLEEARQHIRLLEARRSFIVHLVAVLSDMQGAICSHACTHIYI